MSRKSSRKRWVDPGLKRHSKLRTLDAKCKSMCRRLNTYTLSLNPPKLARCVLQEQKIAIRLSSVDISLDWFLRSPAPSGRQQEQRLQPPCSSHRSLLDR